MTTGTLYDYQIKAENHAGVSAAWSPVLTIMTATIPSTMSAPTID
jgi:chitodextrinase